MQCLIDYITLSGCASPASDSGYELNRLLPGLPLEHFSKIAEADQLTYLEVYADIQRRASLRFDNDITRAFQSRYQLNRITESFDLLQMIGTDTDAAAAKWRGFTIELIEENNYRYVNSSLQVIRLQSIKLYRSAVTVAVTAKVFDIQTGAVLQSITIPANSTAGWTEVTVNGVYYAPRIFVAYDATAVVSTELNIQQDIINKFNDCACNFGFGDCSSAISGATTDALPANVKDADIITGYNLFGLSGVFSIGCSYNPVVCQNKSQFLLPWAYLLGAEAMFESRNSSRFSKFTLGLGAEKASKLLMEYEDRYTLELNTVIAGISLQEIDCCLECNAPYQYVEVHP